MRHGGPDVSGAICWLQLAGLLQTTHFLSDIARSAGCTAMSNEMLFDPPLETHAPLQELLVTEIDYNPTYDDVSGSEDTQALQTPHQSHAFT